MNIMDIVDIQHSIGKMISDLCLIRNTVCTASADELNSLSEYLADNQLEYEKAIRAEVKDKGSDYFVGQLYRSLSSYLVHGMLRITMFILRMPQYRKGFMTG